MRPLLAAMIIAVAALVACGGGGSRHPFSQASRHDKPSADKRAAGLCAATPEVLGNVQSPELIEISGIAASREDDGVLWVHNDSGDTARVFAMDRGGRHLGTYTLPGAEAIDWEDMAIGPGPEKDVDYLYLADIGDNAAQRAEVVVYRAREPAITTTSDTPTAGELSDVARLVLRYPDHPHDAETLLVDPASDDLVIITKELTAPASSIFRAPAAITPGTPYTLEAAGQIDFKALGSKVTPPPDAPVLVAAAPFLPTGGDVSRDGDLVLVRTYGTVWVWPRAHGQSISEALAGTPCEAPSAIEPQGEAIAFDPDGNGYVTISEGASSAINHFEAK